MSKIINKFLFEDWNLKDIIGEESEKEKKSNKNN